MRQRQGQTGEDRHAADEHRAGAALSELAAVFRAGEAQVLPEYLEQRGVRRDRDRHRLAVHDEGGHYLRRTARHLELDELVHAEGCRRGPGTSKGTAYRPAGSATASRAVGSTPDNASP